MHSSQGLSRANPLPDVCLTQAIGRGRGKLAELNVSTTWEAEAPPMDKLGEGLEGSGMDLDLDALAR